ncbi:MAG TPA: DNA-processing protein DprA [Nakamurella sp.]
MNQAVPVLPSEDTVALAGLVRVCEPPSAALARFVDKVGAVAAWHGVLARRAPQAVLAATAARTDNLTREALARRAEGDLVTAAAAGARLIGRQDPGWPGDAVASFQGALARGVRGAAPPVALYVRGRPLFGLPGRGVTIVGSRASSAYGQRVAGEMSHELACRGITVISGAAFGIDTAAHRGALHAGRSGAAGGTPPTTVAVLACGIDRAYPEANRTLLDAIAQSGAVVSEYPPGTTPARHRFLVRNRLIAAFGAATVVVEAGRRSGTLSTAAAAEQLGRLVMAVPGPVTSAMSVGCHLLLSDRFAQLVTGAEDVLAALGRLPPENRNDQREEPTPGQDPLHPTDGLDEVGVLVYDALPTRASCSIDDLVVESGLSSTQVMGALAVLHLHGLAGKEGAHWRRLTPADHR